MVTTCPSGSGTVWLSTAMAPLTVAPGVHPGCSVVVVVVGGTVVVVVGTMVVTVALLPVVVPEQPTSTVAARTVRRITRHPGDAMLGSFRWPTSGEHRGPAATDG